MTYRSLPIATRRLLIANVVVLAVLAHLSMRHWVPVSAGNLAIAMVACGILDCVRIRLVQEDGRLSLGVAADIGMVLLWGPANAAVVTGFQKLVMTVARAAWRSYHEDGHIRVEAPRIVYNVCASAGSSIVAGFVIIALVGRPGIAPFSPMFLAALAGASVYFALNSLDMALLLGTRAERPFWRIWHEELLWTAPQFLASAACAAFVLTIYSFPVWRWTSVLMMAPLFVLHRSYRLYFDRIRSDRAYIEQLRGFSESVVASLATAISAKRHFPEDHLQRVQHYALCIAEELGLGENEREAVRFAALVHNVGNLGVPERLLTKEGPLTAAEEARIRQHVEIGAAILRPVDFPWPVVDYVVAHHERWNGSGYPNGLRGEEIPVGARVIAVASTFAALTSNRGGQRALSFQDACTNLHARAGTDFDPTVVAALVNVLQRTTLSTVLIGDSLAQQLSSDKAPRMRDALEQIARANSEMIAMYDVSESLRGPTDLRAILDKVMQKLEELIPYSTCMVMLENGSGDLCAQAVRGKYSHILLGMRMQIGEGLSGRVFESLETVVNGPASLDLGRRMAPEEVLDLNGSLVVPLRANGITLGTLSLYHEAYTLYTPDHARLLSMIADHCADNVFTALRLQKTEEWALTDPLTEMPNARAVRRTLDAKLQQAARDHTGFAVMMIDLDNFKMVNDVLGHLEGDSVLRSAGEAMKQSIRPDDLLARYAGDEFVMILDRTDEETLSSLAARLSAAVEAMELPQGVRIGASVGWAVCPVDGLNARDLIEAADRTMYRNKAARKGRARTRPSA